MIVKKDSLIKGLDDLADKFTAVVQGYTGEIIISKTGYKYESFKKGTECVLELINGKCDAVIIDYNAKISLEEAKEIEAKANKYIWENHEFEQLWPTPDKLKEIDYRSKKELTGAVRIARFPDADTCACCGIHVKTSAEVGLVILVMSM